jgi:hypothetical protein
VNAQQRIDYAARLAERAQDPQIQALIAMWGPLEPEQLAVIARVFGGSARGVSSPSEAEEAA